MPSKSVINTFMQGMNKDLDKSIRPKESYLHAENFRVTASDSSTSGALENIKGNELLFDGILQNQRIIGSAEIRNYLVLFTTNNNRHDGTGTSKIYVLPIIEGELQPSHTISGTADYVVYSDGVGGTFLDFSILSPIKTIARYESEDVMKIYWTDGYNNVRWVNIADPDLATQEADRFDFIPDAALPKAEIDSLISGSLTAGEVQYTYQLFKSKGAETLFAPMSDLIHLTVGNENLSNSQHYVGGDLNDETGKGVRISIANTNTGYDFIRGIALHYNAFSTIPTVRIFSEQAISTAASTISLNDVGETLGTYEFEEFSVLSRSLFTAEDLETKNNYLFAANITENEFDIGDWDARAYRFEAGDTSLIYHDYIDLANYTYLEITAGAAIDAYTWTEYLVTTGDPFPGTVTGTTYTTENIPESYDCINRFNDYSNDGTGNHQHKFMTDGTTVGAEGLNINVVVESGVDANVILEQVIDYDHTRFTDGAGLDATAYYQLTESETDNSSYTGYASPYIASQYKGYMRDEIYRFGIVFFDDKGRRSFVRWVCDLRMPTQVEEEITGIDSNNILGRILTPRFNVHATEAGALPTGTVAYQIVRVRREGFSDRNILAQGFLTANRLHATTPDEWPVTVEDSTKTNIAGTEYLYLNSPEISFNRNLSYSSGDQLVLVSSATEHAATGVKINSEHARFDIAKAVDWTGYTLGAGSINGIDSALIISPDDTDYDLGGTNTVHIREDTNPAATPAYFKGTSLLVKRTIDYDDPITGEAAAPAPRAATHTVISTADTTGLANNDFVWISGTTNYNGVWEITTLIGNTSFEITTAFAGDDGATGDWYSTDWNAANLAIDSTRWLCNYRRNNWLSQYGGNTYEDRSRNIYQAAGSVETATGTDNVYGGDTFISNFDMFNCVSDLAQTLVEYQSEGLVFPVETTINCDLRHDTSSLNKQLKFASTTQLNEIRMTQEFSGSHEDGTAVTPNEYEQITNLYLYNTVYSQENTAVSYVAKPVDALYSITDTFDTRVKYSDRKIDGEVSDSWFVFRSNNFVDLEKAHGSVNNLEIYKDNLLFWQDHAFGNLAVNERAVLSTDAGTGLVLGTGGLLDHTDYVSRSIGNTNKFGVAVTDRSCYWIDNDIKEVYQFTAGTRGAYNLQSKNDPLSTAKGMSSYLKGQTSIVNVVSGVDKENNEVLFTITPGVRSVLNINVGDSRPRFVVDSSSLTAEDVIWAQGKHFEVEAVDAGDAYFELDATYEPDIDTGDYTAADTIAYVGLDTNKVTFSFNETINSFGAFYSFTPSFYFYFSDKFMTCAGIDIAADQQDLYIHGGGNYSQFYGNYFDSSITVTLNPDYSYTKVFDNLTWYNEVIGQDAVSGGDVNRFSDSFSTIQIYNDYQNSDELDLVYKTQVGSTDVIYDRRERGFTLALPRNAVDKDVGDNEDIFDSNNIDQTQLYKERIRDRHSILKFTYANSASNYRFVCPFIETKYRHSIR